MKMCDCNQGRLPCTCGGIPSPPPMRGGKQPSDIGDIILTIIFSMVFGVACGWQMHGGVCS